MNTDTNTAMEDTLKYLVESVNEIRAELGLRSRSLNRRETNQPTDDNRSYRPDQFQSRTICNRTNYRARTRSTHWENQQRANRSRPDLNRCLPNRNEDRLDNRYGNWHQRSTGYAGGMRNWYRNGYQRPTDGRERWRRGNEDRGRERSRNQGRVSTFIYPCRW